MGEEKENKKVTTEPIRKVGAPIGTKQRKPESKSVVGSEVNLYKIPSELKDAPQNIKKMYMEYLEIDRKMKESSERYFQFINTITGEVEQLDLMGLNGYLQNVAKKKNISPEELIRLEETMKPLQELKNDKSRKKFAFRRYLAPIIGKDILKHKEGEIIELYSKYFTDKEILEKIRDDGFEIKADKLKQFYLTNKSAIDKKRLEFLSSSKELYIATETGRLETLSMLHQRLVALFQKHAVANHSSSNTQEMRQLSSAICNVLEHARKEIKGDEIKLTVDGKIDINASIQANQTIKDITKKIPINLMVIYLVAAKQGIDPSMIITSLVNSFYREFNGFGIINESGKPQDTAELIKNYDWNQIKLYQQNKKEEIGKVTEFEDIPNIQKETIDNNRKKLLKMLESQRQGVENER